MLNVSEDQVVETAIAANDRQVAGTHYASQFQHWDFVTALSLPYLPAQVSKYLIRWKKKNGLQDLEKSKHFLDKFIEERKAWREVSDGLTEKFLDENTPGSPEHLIITCLTRFSSGNISTLELASSELEKLIAQVKLGEGL